MMCSFQLYTVPLILATLTSLGAADQSSWAPYNMNFQQEILNNMQNQQYDQQYQPSDYALGYNVQENDSPSFEAGLTADQGYENQPLSDNLGYAGHGFSGHIPKVESYPVHEHVHESNPEPIKHYKEIIVPLPKNVEFKVNQPVIIPVPHPIPIRVPVPRAVVIPVIKEVTIPVEKSVPYPVERIVHVPKVKEVPFEVVKHIIVPVEKPIPFKVPVHETIIHTKKGSHKF